MSYLDIHAHFAEEGYEFPRTWEEIRAAGVETVVLAGDTLAHSLWHRDFAAAHAGAYFTAGVHPSEAADFSDDTLSALSALAEDEKCIAVGEIGLDYHYPEPPKEVQREVFVKQILLAERAGLPLVVHSRDCAADMLAPLTEMRAHLGRRFVMHCYSHGAQMLPAFAALGAYFSFGGVACFRNAKNVWESVRACPAERILSETDSPYLTPVPFRGVFPNEPGNVVHVVRNLAALRNEKEEELEGQIFSNAERLFFRLADRRI